MITEFERPGIPTTFSTFLELNLIRSSNFNEVLTSALGQIYSYLQFRHGTNLIKVHHLELKNEESLPKCIGMGGSLNEGEEIFRYSFNVKYSLENIGENPAMSFSEN